MEISSNRATQMEVIEGVVEVAEEVVDVRTPAAAQHQVQIIATVLMNLTFNILKDCGIPCTLNQCVRKEREQHIFHLFKE